MYDKYVFDGYKQLITIKCPKNMNVKDLRNWWIEHAERVKIIKKLKLYAIYFRIDFTFGPDPTFDGYEEMWFDYLEDLRKAYESNIWQKELINMEENNLYRAENFQGIWQEGNIVKLKGCEKIPTSPGCHRHIGGLKRPYNWSRKEVKNWFYNHAIKALDEEGAMSVPGIVWYTHSFSIVNAPYGPPFVDAICGNWMYSLDEMKKAFNSEKMKSQNDHGSEVWDYYDSKQAQIIEAEQFIIKK